MAMIFSSVGAGYGTALAGMGIAGMGQFKPELIMKSLIPGEHDSERPMEVLTPPIVLGDTDPLFHRCTLDADHTDHLT